MKKIIAMLVCLYAVTVSTLVTAAPVLVDIDWLKANLDSKNIVILDMTSDDMSYSRYHIPGAVRLSYSDIVTARKDKVAVKVPDSYLARVLGLLGISNNTHVVIYDDMGGLNAGRLFWQLEAIGHKQVSVVDGGIVSWILAGNRVVNTPVKPVPTNYTLSEGAGIENDATLEDILKQVEGRQATLLDVRSEEEYAGDPREPRSGHIPGALWFPWENALDIKNGFKLVQTKSLQSELGKLGLGKPDQPVIAYCRTGHRASQTYLMLRHLGYNKVKLYDASMSEYSQQRDLPVIKGKTP